MLPANFLSIMTLNVHIFADDGKIINWGRNTYGQLGCSEYQRSLSWKPQMMDNIENVTQLAVGAEHNIAVLGTFELIFYFMCNVLDV
jgi:alpha-tubulin suppressor-like RCC1 family protein